MVGYIDESNVLNKDWFSEGQIRTMMTFVLKYQRLQKKY